MKYNFNGFTTKANEALNQAISSAENLGHTYVGSEHLLLGLLKIGGGFAAALLNKSGITAEGVGGAYPRADRLRHTHKAFARLFYAACKARS